MGDVSLAERYRAVRALTVRLTEPLEPEDFVVQSMPDASPTKWHLAHTTWFFETFLLVPRGVPRLVEAYNYLFNSYYNGVGHQFSRPDRGLLSRPTIREVFAYREHVDGAVLDALAGGLSDAERATIELGLNHEQQHQELLATDIKHVLAQNPLRPSYGAPAAEDSPASSVRDVAFDGGLVRIGREENARGFFYDNEGPAHQRYVPPFRLADRLVTVGEYAAFIRDGGYHDHRLWLSEGWAWRHAHDIEAPLYWDRLNSEHDEPPTAFTLNGHRALSAAEPVCHVSYFEADAYARWACARLPREEELELALRDASVGEGHFVERGHLHPVAASTASGVRQLYGDVWEWTASSYAPFPGYVAPEGAVGEYNGKFMCNQYVLKGGSCASAQSHLRATYRNFFPTSSRWQFTGLRLAKDG